MREALVALDADVAEFVNKYGHEPAPNSPAAKEQEDSGRAEWLSAAYSQGHMLLESAADHAFALTCLLAARRIPTMAPYTCVRAGLEAAAISCWLLSNRIDARERISRNFAFMYEGLDQQRKLANVTRPADSEGILSGIEELEAEARTLGYAPVEDRNNKRIGIAQRMPSATECIRETLDEEALFRLFSAVAHSHTWALLQLGFHTPVSSEPNIFSKKLQNHAAGLLLIKAADAIAKPTWAKAFLFGHDLDNLSQILETRYKEMGVGGNRHFWVGDRLT